MGKTIRQLAEELGVTKPTIAKAIRELDIEPQKIGNRNELSDGQCEQIKLQISKKVQISDLQKSPTETQKSPIETEKAIISLLETQMTALQAELSEKNRQIAVKDEQIESLTTSNAVLTSTIQAMTEQQSHLTEALRAAQALHAGTIQERLAVQEQDEQVEQDLYTQADKSQENDTGLNPTSSEKKRNIFQRFGDWLAREK